MTPQIRPVGDDAVLVTFDAPGSAVALHRSLRRRPLPGVGHTVPGARTLLIPFAPGRTDAATLARALRTLTADPPPDPEEAHRHELAVVYDGEDLATAAELLGWSVEQLVRRHTTATWRVAFMGFAPGFGYLAGDDPALSLPRRDTPRTRVPPGAVAMAGDYSGVYPRESPGGWQLLGRTDAVVWDTARRAPALWRPGDTVRFAPAREVATVRVPRPSTPPGAPADPVLEVLAAGLQTLVQDLGRPGSVDLGVSGSGAADPRSFRAAQRAVGNRTDAAALETLGGLRLRALRPAVVATAGAAADLEVTGGTGPSRAPLPGRPFVLAPGEELSVGAARRGLRTYVAVRGGLDVTPVLGSRATDLLAGLGPDPVTAGDVLGTAGDAVEAVATADTGAPDPARLPAPGDVVTLPVVLGPRDDWFTPDALDVLASQEWEVTARSDRVGLRLTAEQPLTRTATAQGAELPSEGAVTGALQVPPDGLPVLLGPDHPLTGGYPVVATVAASHRWLLGQIPPGARIRCRPVRT
ncbi:urea amidolyase family protein [Isoptericola sediminis]|uniref:5-oxoprolinase/urea amidolyase family protein n=1 Tax=Isoptericola sediminis TaxID=2733572 RepID=A0A849KFB9_9MICO|nr:urea amidolyase family protein [Isoptericola sediminis]NNU27263.1 5-oxoprolinase/urea amidolyase family protein [Isoptericola sediminis]